MPAWRPSDEQSRQTDFARANKRARALRRKPTRSEARLWKALRKLNRAGAQLRRQPALGPWVYDFGDISARLLIEVDGGVHERLAEVAVRDEEKSAWAAANGFRLLRFKNDDVWGRLDEVVETIRLTISAPHPLPPPHTGEGKGAS